MIPAPWRRESHGNVTVIDPNAAPIVELLDAWPGNVDWPRTLGVSPTGGDPADERHQVVVGDGSVTIRATAPEGVERGRATLRQLLVDAQAAAVPGDAGAELPCETISDAPRFAWRGLSLDVVRHLLTAGEVCAVIDLAAAYKLNVIHLHLTDNEAWRLPVPGFDLVDPEIGFSADDLARIRDHAAARYVTVVPEVDTPGHVMSVETSHPELCAVDAEAALRRPYLVPDAPGVPELRAAIVRGLGLLATGPYVHIGGDEAFGMPEELYVEYVTAMQRLVRDAGLRPVGWQEVSRADPLPGEVVQLWVDFAQLDGEPIQEQGPATLPIEVRRQLATFFRRSQADLPRMLTQGVRVLLSPTSHSYLDQPHSEDSADPSQSDLKSRLGLPHYPARTLEALYDWEPLDVVGGDDPEGTAAGIEAALWCETVTSLADVQMLITTRLPGVAERAWSWPSDETTWPSYRDRLASQTTLWRERGWGWYAADSVDWALS